SSFEKEFAREFGGHSSLTAGMFKLRERSAGHLYRQFPVHGPKREANTIPTKIAEATIRLQSTLGTNISPEKIFRGQEAESRCYSPDGADGSAITEHFADSIQSRAVHKHDPVHELHPMLPAGLQHFRQLFGTGRARLLADNVLARYCRLLDP